MVIFCLGGALRREHGNTVRSVTEVKSGAGRERRRLSGWLWIGIGVRSEQPNGSRPPCRSHCIDPAFVVVNIFVKQKS